MSVTFFQGSLETANLFISIFVLYYAYKFISKSHRHKDRLPWDMLIVAIVFFALFELFGFLNLMGVWKEDNMRYLFHTLFAGFLLFSFAFQHHLIHHQASIRIHNKQKVKLEDIDKK